MLTAGLALGGAALNAYSGSKSGDAASHAQEEQRRALMEDLDFRKKIYAEEKAYTDPIRKYLKQEALSNQPLGYAEAKAGIDRDLASAERAARGMNYGLGMANSGQALNAPLTLGLAGAQAKAQAWAEGQKARRGLALQALSAGNPMAAAGGVSNATQNLAGMQGAQADMFNRAANQSWSNAAQGINYGLPALANYINENRPVTRRFDYGSPQMDNLSEPIEELPVQTNPWKNLQLNPQVVS